MMKTTKDKIKNVKNQAKDTKWVLSKFFELKARCDASIIPSP